MCLLKLVVYVGGILWFLLALYDPNGPEPVRAVPADLSFPARIAYYHLHPRCWVLFYPQAFINLTFQGIDLFEEHRWQTFSWRACFTGLALQWIAAALMTRLDAWKFRDRPWPLPEMME
jgi:hypothetical protein